MISFTGAQLLSHQRSNSFWGEDLRFAIRDNFSFQGKILDLANQSGAAGVLKQLSGQNDAAIDYDFLQVNGTFLGLAQINNISYQEGIDVREKNYTLTATVFTSGDVSRLNYSDPLYSGVNLNNINYPVYLIENFSEDFSSNISEDGTYIEQQRIQLRFISGASIGTAQNPISMAQQFANNLVNSNPQISLINSFYSGYAQKLGKRTCTESYNLISNQIDIVRNFKTLRDISGSYSINYTNSLQIDDQGITNVKEVGRVQGLIPDQWGNYYSSALSGEQYEVNNNSFNRCNDVFNTYQSPNSNPLSPTRITYGQTLNKFIDLVQYEVSYTNNPKANTLFSWEYTQSAERERTECTYKIVEQGTVQGYSTNCAPGEKYPNAVIGFSGVKTGIYNRCYSFYTGFSTFANPIKLIEQSNSQDKFKGIIKYSQVFTDNLIYSYSGAKKTIIQILDDYSTPSKNIFNIVGQKQIAQGNGIMTLAKRGLSINLAGFRGTTLLDYLNVATTIVNNNIPSGTDPYISNLEYDWSPRLNQFNLTSDWTYYQSDLNLNTFLL